MMRPRWSRPVAAADAELANQMRTDVGVADVGEVAVLGPADESRVARCVEPAFRRAVGDDHRRRSRHALLLPAPATATGLARPLASAPVTAPATAAAALLVVVVLVLPGPVVVVVVGLVHLAAVESRSLRRRRGFA